MNSKVKSLARVIKKPLGRVGIRTQAFRREELGERPMNLDPA